MAAAHVCRLHREVRLTDDDAQYILPCKCGNDDLVTKEVRPVKFLYIVCERCGNRCTSHLCVRPQWNLENTRVTTYVNRYVC